MATKENKGGIAAEMEAMMNSRPASNGESGFSLGGSLQGLDLSKTGDGSLIPNDEWVDVEVLEAKGMKAATESNMVVLKVKTVAPGQYAGVTMYDNLVLTDKALWKFKSAAKACGLLSSDGATFIGSSEKDFVSKIMRCQVIQSEYEGRVRNKVKGGYSAATGEYGPGHDGPEDSEASPF